MAKKTNIRDNINSSDATVGVVGIILILCGSSAIGDQINLSLNNDPSWKFALGAVIFGSILLGSAITRVSIRMRRRNGGKKEK